MQPKMSNIKAQKQLFFEIGSDFFMTHHQSCFPFWNNSLQQCTICAKKSSPRNCRYGAIKWPSYITHFRFLHYMLCPSKLWHKHFYTMWEIFAWVVHFCSKLRKVFLMMVWRKVGCSAWLMEFWFSSVAENWQKHRRRSCFLWLANEAASMSFGRKQSVHSSKGEQQRKKKDFSLKRIQALTTTLCTRNRGNKLPWHKHVLYER